MNKITLLPMTRIFRSSFVLLVAVLFSRPISAAESPRIIESLTPQQLIKILEGYGLSETRIDQDGDVIVRMKQMSVLIMVTSTRHTGLRFRFAVPFEKATLRMVNEWNRSMAFTKAYLEDDGSVSLEMDLSLEGGVTEARVRDAIIMYEKSLGVFLTKLKELEKTSPVK